MASCERDDFLEKELPSGSYPVKYSTKSYQELENNTAFTSTFKALHQHFNVGSTSLQGRGSYMEEEYGFSIDSSVVEVAKTDKYTSYTMYISRKEHPKNYFENLVIEVTDTAATKAYVVQYFPTSSIKPVPEHDSYAFGYDFNFIPIKYNEGSKIDAGGCTPITVTICYESWGDGSDTPHLKTELCNNPHYLTSYIIGGNCAGNSGPSFPNDSPTQGNNSGPSYPYNPSGSGYANNTTITNPLLCYKTQVDCPPELENMEIDPCFELKNMDKEKPYLNVLKTKTHENREYGYYFDEGLPGATEAELSSPSSLATLRMPVGGSIYGSGHTHPNMETTNRLPMFAIEDIMWVGKAYFANTLNPRPPISKFFNILTVDINGTAYHFAVKVENRGEYLNAYNTKYGSLTKLEKFNLEAELGKEYTKIKKDGGNFKKYVGALYKFLSQENINGIDIYKANLNSFNDIENWSKLDYDPNNTNNPISEIPCE